MFSNLVKTLQLIVVCLHSRVLRNNLKYMGQFPLNIDFSLNTVMRTFCSGKTFFTGKATPDDI